MLAISLFKRSLLLGLSLLTVLGLQLLPIQRSPAVTEAWIPTTAMTWDEQYVRLPDWSQLTFDTLPPLMTDGAFEASADIIQSLGYDPSRRWVAGQPLDTVLKLGDFQTSLYLQLFNLQSIAETTHLDLNRIALDALDLLEWQTLEDLVTAIPTLGNFTLDQVPPLSALMDAVVPQNLGTNLHDLTLSAIAAQFPDLAQQSLGQLGEQLSQFALSDIPGLSTTPLQAFKDWGNSTLAEVPGLSAVPFAQIPNPLSVAGAMGQIDVVYGPAETNRQQTISGSYQQGFQVPCQQDCGHIELTGAPALHGKQWISGQFQSVQGGEGILAAVNGGQEPTGRHPFGEAFKVTVWDIDERTGTVSTALFFRMCQRGGWFTPDLGCTPYFIGPVPFLTYRETEFLPLGALSHSQAASSPATSSSASVAEQSASAAPQDKSSIPFPASSTVCQTSSDKDTVSELVSLVVPPKGDANAVGPFVCDGQGHCGRALGRYGLMSYRPDVRSLIESQPGGAAFLARIDAGEEIADEALLSFFPLTAQTHQIEADLMPLLQQAQAEGNTRTALLKRVKQFYWGGTGVPVEAVVSDLHGNFLNSFSEEILCLPTLSSNPNALAQEAQ